MNDVELQREITRVALGALDGTGFALAGLGAIREHGVTDRPSEDVDLFTSNTSTVNFSGGVERVVDALQTAGYSIEFDVDRRSRQFVRLHVSTALGERVDIDMAMDWRQADPVTLSLGPVLSIDDAVHSKVNALYGRAAARDFLDVDAIRATGRFTDAELIAAAIDRDAGFEVGMFASQLEYAQRLRPDMVAEYGVDADQLEAIKERFATWASQLRANPAEGSSSRRQ